MQEIIDTFAVNTQKLQKECMMHEAIHGITFADNSNSINSMSTYNALRKLYRDQYDLRSIGRSTDINNPNKIVGREINPRNNLEIPINYLNDFSMSPKFKDNSFTDSICDKYSQSYYAFFDKNGYYKDLHIKRSKIFLNGEYKKKKSREYTSDFFSYNIQVNPLLYTYSLDNRIMDADYFLEQNFYKSVFSNDSFLTRGNQYCIPLWLQVINSRYNYVNVEDDDGEVIGSREV